MDQDQTTLTHLNNPYSFRSVKYWCYNCSKQFSKLKVSEDSEVICPICSCISEEITVENDPRNFTPFVPNQSNTHTDADINNNFNINQPTQNNQNGIDSQIPSSNSRTNNGFSLFFTQIPIVIRSENGVVIEQETPLLLNLGRENGLDSILGGLLGLLGARSPAPNNDLLNQIIEEFLRNDPNRHGPPPASDNAISNLKNTKFHSDHLSKECTICQDEYKNEETLLEMPCEHDFHEECLVNWLKLHNTCPICRKPVETNSENQETNAQC